MNRTQLLHGCLAAALAIACAAAGLALLRRPAQQQSAGRADKQPDKLVVACGDDAAGALLSSVFGNAEDTELTDADTDCIEMGDCCASPAQFALSTGEVDVAALCPDAVTALQKTGQDYRVLGTAVYDGNVLVTRPNDTAAPAAVGYMDRRGEQLQLLRGRFGEGPRYQAMYPSGLGYALETGAVDAAAMDVTVALKLGYPMQPLSDGTATTLIVARQDLLGTAPLKHFIKTYNDAVAALNQNGGAAQLLCSHTGAAAGEEEQAQWKTLNVRYGYLSAEEK